MGGSYFSETVFLYDKVHMLSEVEMVKIGNM